MGDDRKPVGVVSWSDNGNVRLIVVCDDGTVWDFLDWNRARGWSPVAPPIPGTAADCAKEGEAT